MIVLILDDIDKRTVMETDENCCNEDTRVKCLFNVGVSERLKYVFLLTS